MFLSRLEVNVDIAPGRLWLRNLYRVHQRLCMAFPSSDRKQNDAEFLTPYDPADFPYAHALDYRHDHVHGKRTNEQAFLFRIDHQLGGSPVITVQSAIEPVWDYAFQNAPYLLACRPQVKEVVDSFPPGQSLKFRLAANPTRRLSRNSKGPDGAAIKEEWIGKRVPVPPEQLKEWLTNHGAKGGFMVERFDVVQPGYRYFAKDDNTQHARPLCVLYEGVLKVIDADAFAKTVVGGLGPAKGFGFGLLSLARVKE